MNRKELISLIIAKKSFLCIGLDPDITKIPRHLLETEDPVFEFNKAIIDVTHDLAIAYKPNFAFYECHGVKGWQSLTKTIQYLKQFEVFTIADAKRGDIGNTSKQYARTVFDPSLSGLDFDAITVAPYMGSDSVTPFLEFPDKWVIVLALTSNKGADDFQLLVSRDTEDRFFEEVIIKSLSWGSASNMMYVVGATKAQMLADIRALVPEHFLLVPGVGAQGGSLREVAEFGMTRECGLIVNSSRNIIYASTEADFAQKARQEAGKMQQEMKSLLKKVQID